MEPSETKTDYMTLLCAVIAIMALTYILMLSLFIFHRPSYQYLVGNPLTLYDQFRAETKLYNMPYRPILWNAERTEKKGITVNRNGQTFSGLTLFISAHEKGAQLIDMQGNSVHKWALPYEKACPDEHKRNVPEHMYAWFRAHLNPDGSLLAIFDCYHSNGLVKLDKNSDILWVFKGGIHHDIDQNAAGDIYTFAAAVRTEHHPAFPYIKKPFHEEFLVILNAQGQEKKRIALYDSFIGSPAEHMLSQLVYDPTGGRLNAGDMLHPNSIEIIKKPEAGTYPFLVEGHIMLSFRNNSLLAILDPESEKITHALFGGWRDQHDPRFWNDGTIIMFDNEGWLGEGGASRVIQLDPETGDIFWQYTGDKENYFYSAFNSSVDALPNGNILVTESGGGRLFELSPAGYIVWEYINPHRVTYQGKTLVPAVFRGRRYHSDDLTFLN